MTCTYEHADLWMRGQSVHDEMSVWSQAVQASLREGYFIGGLRNVLPEEFCQRLLHARTTNERACGGGHSLAPAILACLRGHLSYGTFKSEKNRIDSEEYKYKKRMCVP